MRSQDWRPPFRLYPELDLFDLPEAERAQRLMEAKGAARLRRRKLKLRAASYVLALAAIAGVWFTGWLWAIPLPWWGMVFGVLAETLYSVAGFWLFRPRIRRWLRRELIRRGVPVCLSCGYDLRGQVRVEPPPRPWPKKPVEHRFSAHSQNVERCPECGHTLTDLLNKAGKLTEA